MRVIEEAVSDLKEPCHCGTQLPCHHCPAVHDIRNGGVREWVEMIYGDSAMSDAIRERLSVLAG